MTNEEFRKLVLSQVPEGDSFRPMAIYDPDDDSIEFLITNESHRIERLDPLVSVYYGRESKEIVGSLIKGVSRLLKDVVGKMPGFAVEIEDKKIKLVHLVRAHRWATQPRERMLVMTYKTLEHLAEVSGVEADIDGLAELCLS